MKLRSNLFIAALALLSSPAFAVCEFETTAGPLNLHSADEVDPYLSALSGTVEIPIDPDCGLVYVDISAVTDALQRDASVIETIPFVVSIANAAKNTQGLWVIREDNRTDLQAIFTMMMNPNNPPRSGLYSQDISVEMFSDADGQDRIDTTIENVFLTVDQVMTISLSGTAGETLDLGELTPGQDKINDAMTLRAVSNDGYEVSFESDNGWALELEVVGDGTYRIPYGVSVDGEAVSNASDTLARANATASEGRAQRIRVVARPEGNLRAGAYEDLITITITGASTVP